MKKLFFFVMAAFVCQVALAQEITRPQTSANVGLTPVKQGNWMVGGTLGGLGYGFESKSFNINIEPSAAYFVSDGLAIGAKVLGGLRAVSGMDNEWSYGITPMVRYFFPQGSSATGRFFGQGEVGIGGSSVGSDVSFLAGLSAGYAHFITQSVALETTLGYRYNKANISTSTSASGLNIGLGFQIYLPGRK
jgi:hypothetical protein